MKLREIAKLLRTAKSAPSAIERGLALNALSVALVKAYAAKHETDELETMQVLLQLLWEPECAPEIDRSCTAKPYGPDDKCQNPNCVRR